MNDKGVIKEIIDSWRNLSAKQLAKDIASNWRDLLAIFLAAGFTNSALAYFGWQNTTINHMAVFFGIVILVAFIFFIIESIIKAIRHEQDRTDTAD